jgi:hypothetical protein
LVVERDSIPAYPQTEEAPILKTLLIILIDLVGSSTALAQGLNTPQTEVDRAITTASSLPLTATSETSESPGLGGSDALDATEKKTQ